MGFKNFCNSYTIIRSEQGRNQPSKVGGAKSVANLYVGCEGGCRGAAPPYLQGGSSGVKPRIKFFDIRRDILVILYVNSNLILDIKGCVGSPSSMIFLACFLYGLMVWIFLAMLIISRLDEAVN